MIHDVYKSLGMHRVANDGHELSTTLRCLHLGYVDD